MEVISRFFIFAFSIYLIADSFDKLEKGVIEGRKVALIFALAMAFLVIEVILIVASFF